jgi:hypothetical protein
MTMKVGAFIRVFSQALGRRTHIGRVDRGAYARDSEARVNARAHVDAV